MYNQHVSSDMFETPQERFSNPYNQADQIAQYVEDKNNTLRRQLEAEKAELLKLRLLRHFAEYDNAMRSSRETSVSSNASNTPFFTSSSFPFSINLLPQNVQESTSQQAELTSFLIQNLSAITNVESQPSSRH